MGNPTIANLMTAIAFFGGAIHVMRPVTTMHTKHVVTAGPTPATLVQEQTLLRAPRENFPVEARTTGMGSVPIVL